MTPAPRRAFLSFCKLCGWSHTDLEMCKKPVLKGGPFDFADCEVKIEAASEKVGELVESLQEGAVQQAEDETRPVFGSPVGTVGHFTEGYPELEQRVEFNEPYDGPCICFSKSCEANHVTPCRRKPARNFGLDGWPDSLPLCEVCMPRDLGPPKKSEPPTNAENAAPTEPPPAECRHETIWRDRRGTGWTCWDCGFRQEPVKASHFIRALADEMVPPIKSGSYAELERHDHKRMRAEIEAIIRWLDREEGR